MADRTTVFDFDGDEYCLRVRASGRIIMTNITKHNYAGEYVGEYDTVDDVVTSLVDTSTLPNISRLKSALKSNY